MIQVRLPRAGWLIVVCSLVVPLVGSSEGCGSGSSGPGMVADPPPRQGGPDPKEKYTSHKPKAKGRSSRAR